MFVNYYMINVNSYSSIRYFINNLITLCEWIYYNPMVIDKKEVAQQRESFDCRNSRNSYEQKKKGVGDLIVDFFRPNKEQSQNEEEIERFSAIFSEPSANFTKTIFVSSTGFTGPSISEFGREV